MPASPPGSIAPRRLQLFTRADLTETLHAETTEVWGFESRVIRLRRNGFAGVCAAGVLPRRAICFGKKLREVEGRR